MQRHNSALALGERRAPGETSTHMQAAGSRMESESGSCPMNDGDPGGRRPWSVWETRIVAENCSCIAGWVRGVSASVATNHMIGKLNWRREN